MVGVLLIAMTLGGSFVARLPLSAAMLYLAVGYAIGPAGIALIDLDAVRDAALLERLAEVAVLISLFTVGMKLELPFSTLGFLQYLGPTCQFILAIAVYGEPFAAEQLLAFGLIWLGLAVFSADLVRAARGAAPISRTGR